MVRAEYEAYTRNAIVQLRRVREGAQIEEDHMRNRQMIVRWLMANTKAIEERTRDGKTYLVMVDAAAFREGVGTPAGRGAANQVGGRLRRREEAVRDLRRALRSEAARPDRARVEKLNLPSYSGFVMPKLTAVTGGQMAR